MKKQSNPGPPRERPPPPPSPPTIEGMVRTLAKNSGVDLTAIDIGKKLKNEWRSNHSGGCKILSIGDDCECHLCLIHSLVTIAHKALNP